MPYCENCGTEVNPNANFCKNCGKPTNPRARAQQPFEQPQQQPYSQPQQPQPQTNVPAQQQRYTPQPQSYGPAYTPQSPPQQSPPVQAYNSPQDPPQMQRTPPTQIPTQPQGSSTEPVIGTVFLRKLRSLGRYDSYAGVITNQRMIFAQLTPEMQKNEIQKAKDRAKAEGKGFLGQWSDQLKTSFNLTQRYLNMDPQTALTETPGNFQILNNTIGEIRISVKNIGQPEQNRHEYEIEIKSNMGNYQFRTDENNDTVNFLKQVYGNRVKTPFGYFSAGGVNIRIG